MADKLFQCEIHAEKYTGKLSKLKPTGVFYYTAPFQVKERDLFRYLSKDSIHDLMQDCDAVGQVHHDRCGDRWTRLK